MQDASDAAHVFDCRVFVTLASLGVKLPIARADADLYELARRTEFPFT